MTILQGYTKRGHLKDRQQTIDDCVFNYSGTCRLHVTWKKCDADCPKMRKYDRLTNKWKEAGDGTR